MFLNALFCYYVSQKSVIGKLKTIEQQKTTVLNI